jgi:hypothetical protein
MRPKNAQNIPSVNKWCTKTDGTLRCVVRSGDIIGDGVGLRLVLVALGTAAYVGLAVMAWGGFRPFFSHPALVALVVVVLALSGVALFAGGNLRPGVREDRSNRWVIAAFALIGLLDAYLPAYTDHKENYGRSTLMPFAG